MDVSRFIDTTRPCDGYSSIMDDLIGKQIDQYRIEALLGEGGMGAVYRALDSNLARPVALKIMHRQFATQPEFRQRFLQEA
jgi:eukaryotic-like serine/threonine-protein kinase